MSEQGLGAVAIALDLQIKNAEKFMEFIQGAVPTMAPYGGRILIAYDVSEHISTEFGEGRHFFIVLEWPNRDAFHRWQNSPEYKPWRDNRARSVNVNIALCKPWII
jgi:uncharacterized protein (DUF1330 family)